MVTCTNVNLIHRTEAIRAAKELCYSDVVIKKIKDAKTDTEITRILVDARKGILK